MVRVTRGQDFSRRLHPLAEKKHPPCLWRWCENAVERR
jgi:hypothetical protein